MGNDKYLASTNPTSYIRLDPNLPGIEKKHCALKKSPDNSFLLLIPVGETYVNDRLVKESLQLFNNFTLRIGKHCLFRIENPNEASYQKGAHIMKGKQTNEAALNVPPNYGTLYDNTASSNVNPVSSSALNRPRSPSEPIKTSQSTVQSGNTSGTKPSEGLPGLLEFPDEGEDALLSNICATNQSNCQFKLAPAYTMYMMLRFRLSQKYKSEYTFGEKLHTCSVLIHKMVNYMREAVDTNHLDKHVLPYWLANSAELLYFLKQDIHLSQVSYDAQELLADCVQITFKYLVNIMQQQLDSVLMAFYDPSDHVEDVQSIESSDNSELPDNAARPTLKQVIQVLNETMTLLRIPRVNAALTIQLFSQLFHFISMWLFNRLVKDQRSGLCSRYWGAKLTRRLSKVQVWAEKQGLELAADCHLSRVIQAAFLLQAPKHDIQDLSTISSNCFALNSLQIKCLLKNYMLASNEPQLSPHLCNNLISIAQNTADEVLKQEGRNLQLEEEVDLQLPFLLPEDGHSCDQLKGLPAGLLDFIELLQNAGHCWLWQNTQGPGSWKKFMIKEQTNVATHSQSASSANLVQAKPATPSEPRTAFNVQQNGFNSHAPVSNNTPTAISHLSNAASLAKSSPQLSEEAQSNSAQFMPTPSKQGPAMIKLKLAKKNNSLGLSIVGAKGTNQVNSGIYVKSVVPNGAADEDGRLEAGDQLLAVDEQSLINVTQERAAELMCKSGPVVTLTVAKEAAFYHDLDALLSKSPASNQQKHSIATSMPLLNQPGQSNPPNQQHVQAHFASSTLPRNPSNPTNKIQNGQANGELNGNMESAATLGNCGSYRVRSMSQEILRPNSSTSSLAKSASHQNGRISPVKTARSQVVSPPHQARALPNEQMRYGSERPNQMSHAEFASRSVSQRGLHNEFGPRYGSERPASNQQIYPARFIEHTSPIKHQPKLRQASLSELDEINYHNQQNLIAEHQAKAEELYNRNNMAINRHSSNNDVVSYQTESNGQYKTLPSRMTNGGSINGTNMNEPNIITDEQQRTKSFGQLYEQIWSNNSQGQKNHNGHQIPPIPYQRQMPNSIEEIGVKHFETNNGHQINGHQLNGQHLNGHPMNGHQMNGHQMNGQQINGHQLNGHQINGNQMNGPHLNLQQLNGNQLNGHQLNGHQLQYSQRYDMVDTNNARRPPSRLAMPSSQTSSSNVRVIPINRIEESGICADLSTRTRNYENQSLSNQNLQKPPPLPQTVSNGKPMIPNKPFNINFSSTSNLYNASRPFMDSNDELNRNEETAIHPPNSSNAKVLSKQQISNGNAALNWEREMHREREDEDLRIEMLKQRIELMQSLEMKQYRTSEEENRLNKLRTEIEFDKRVVEMNMNNMDSFLEETAEEIDMDYSPEIRERLANQMRQELLQRRNKLEELNHMTQKININVDHQNDEASKVIQEMKRDKKHVEFGPNGYFKNGHPSFSLAQNENGFCISHEHQDSDGRYMESGAENAKMHKHVQFMSEAQMLSPKFNTPPIPSTIPGSLNKNTNSSNSSDQVNSSNTPVQQTKRVMFSDTSNFLEFERHDANIDMPHTPSVIGANEVYVDQRLKKKQQQMQQQLENVVEGEKLSFKDKMRLFAKQSGEAGFEVDNKIKVSKKQREIESKFETK